MVDMEMLGIVIAVSTGGAGFVLAVLTWLSFRGAPFGDALVVLILFMGAFTVYHASLAVWGEVPTYVLAVESLTFALVAVFMGLMVRIHYRYLRVPKTEATAE
ncbi:hypothetical protein BRC93_12495 [Halobacteriales archaeon QS_5_70_15]|nr:MAG: hypothetical protein BRC93_12495 [Halobacteriales archaeon QS_5_70_15]